MSDIPPQPHPPELGSGEKLLSPRVTRQRSKSNIPASTEAASDLHESSLHESSVVMSHPPNNSSSFVDETASQHSSESSSSGRPVVVEAKLNSDGWIPLAEHPLFASRPSQLVLNSNLLMSLASRIKQQQQQSPNPQNSTTFSHNLEEQLQLLRQAQQQSADSFLGRINEIRDKVSSESVFASVLFLLDSLS